MTPMISPEDEQHFVSQLNQQDIPDSMKNQIDKLVAKMAQYPEYVIGNGKDTPSSVITEVARGMPPSATFIDEYMNMLRGHVETGETIFTNAEVAKTLAKQERVDKNLVHTFIPAYDEESLRWNLLCANIDEEKIFVFVHGYSNEKILASENPGCGIPDTQAIERFKQFLTLHGYDAAQWQVNRGVDSSVGRDIDTGMYVCFVAKEIVSHNKIEWTNDANERYKLLYELFYGILLG